MKNLYNFIFSVLVVICLLACDNTQKDKQGSSQDSLIMKNTTETPINNNFGADLDFLKLYDTTVITLANANAQIIVSPKFQARIMTATAGGREGMSIGWLNYPLIKSGKLVPHINAFGGADRFWLGPEGGQYAIFFKKGDSFDGQNWQTPAPIDSESFDLVSQSESMVKLQKQAQLTNYAGTTFDIRMERTIRLLGKAEVEKIVANELLEKVQFVGYQSENQVTNIGKEAWTKEKGLLSIWILGMFNASPANTVVVPIVEGKESELGIKVNDDYFGKLATDRLVAKEKVIYFKADSKLRSKIGISPQRSKDIMGSYDSDKQLLTIVKFTFDPQSKDYVNSQWVHQEQPYKGDVSNSYNDDQNLGNVYELETSSAAKALRPNQSMLHTHSTFHFLGDKVALDAIAQKLLGVGVEEISNAFTKN
ncbi:MAG: hypothetical protein EAZ08_07860 [Cytophagales bacterium]|nr:MAG: hypothetical protein EAZ08_07860 [Cytophagales bacterium]